MSISERSGHLRTVPERPSWSAWSHGATAAVSGGGEIKVHALRALTAAVNGGGLVRYLGNPRLTTAIRGGGAVHAVQ